ncbi:MAG: cytochrome c biogenesis protein ResB [Bacteroidales bacterium]|jgi:hypothetical protein|nr:cytochrome c biogenesis protein ResB [Bacteroidales bacterium]MDD4214418.1 cytochrome c biogenesis protein ResB [Bacteroidales bacterium]
MNPKEFNTGTKNFFLSFLWEYRGSFLISFCILFTGFIIEYITGGKGIALPGWPANLIMLTLFIAYIITFHIIVTHPIKKWLSGHHAAVSVITTFVFLILLMAFIPQGELGSKSFVSQIGLTHVIRSWPYFLISMFLLFILGLTILRRFLPFSFRNFAFTLNHLGLFIVLSAASLGAADTYTLSMVLNENQITKIAQGESGKHYEIDFGIELLRFKMDEYPPQIFMVSEKGEILYPHKKPLEAGKGNKEMRGNWLLEVQEYIENAYKDSMVYFSTTAFGSAPAAKLMAHNTQTGKTLTGWVSCGSMFVSPEYFILSETEKIAMTVPHPKKFSSLIKLHYMQNETKDITVEVNQPAKFRGWTIYQSGYDAEMGKWSTRSIVQLVRDPWLPVVYAGFFMIIAGALYLLWLGKIKR